MAWSPRESYFGQMTRVLRLLSCAAGQLLGPAGAAEQYLQPAAWGRQRRQERGQLAGRVLLYWPLKDHCGFKSTGGSIVATWRPWDVRLEATYCPL